MPVNSTPKMAPGTPPRIVRKFSGLLRYSQGTATDGFSATAMAYANSWNASDQLALRAITTGQVGLFGEIDPTDGGDTSRFMLSTRFAHSDDNGMWKANAYVVKYTLNLFNNFTWFTTNPTLGDQFHQSDDRIYSGGAVSRTFNGTLFSLPSQTVVGLQTRDDDINVGLTNTFRRQFLSNTLFDHVNEGNVGVYAENTTRWTDWWRTTLGLRGDYFAASVNSMLQPANSGNPNAALPSPKFTSVFGPFYKTEFFLGAGLGYHSNDARGVVTSQVPGDPSTPQSGTPFLVRSAGAEVGARTKIVPGLDSSISLFALRQNSELFFDGDTGTTVPGPPSLRTGIEITNNYQPVSWMRFDADLALSRARFIGPDTAQQELFNSLTGFPQAQIGNAPGNFIPEAPWMVASAGITLGERTGWFSTLRWRYISSRPLTEDGVFQSPPVNTINGRVGYQFANGWRIQLDALNLLNSSSYNASYAYGALLPSDALFAKCFPASGAPTVPAAVCQNGFMDYSIHPLDPTAVRLTLAGPIDSIDIPRMAKRIQTCAAHLSAAGAELRLDGLLCRRLRRQHLVQNERLAGRQRERRKFPASTATRRAGAAEFSSASTTCCRRALCLASRLIYRPAAPRRRRSRTPPASARTRLRSSTAKRYAVGLAMPPTMCCSMQRAALPGPTLSSSARN